MAGGNNDRVQLKQEEVVGNDVVWKGGREGRK